jgi:hypothetical protein
MSMDRSPRLQFAQKIFDIVPAQWQSNAVGSFSTLNALFAHDLNNGVLGALKGLPSVDKLIKLAILLEIYGLHDSAYEVLSGGADILGKRIDVEKGCRLLLQDTTKIAMIDRELQLDLDNQEAVLNSDLCSVGVVRDLIYRINHSDVQAAELLSKLVSKSGKVE